MFWLLNVGPKGLRKPGSSGMECVVFLFVQQCKSIRRFTKKQRCCCTEVAAVPTSGLILSPHLTFSLLSLSCFVFLSLLSLFPSLTPEPPYSTVPSRRPRQTRAGRGRRPNPEAKSLRHHQLLRQCGSSISRSDSISDIGVGRVQGGRRKGKASSSATRRVNL